MDEIEDLERGPKVPKGDHGEGLVNCMLKKIDALRGNPNDFTIFRVPENIRKNKPELFDPSVISIGPYHHGRPHLLAMEETKWRYLRDFLSRENCTSLQYCVETIRALEMQARGCYSETIKMDSDKFIEMMVLDGCFILEYLIQLGLDDSGRHRDGSWSSKLVRTDLILIENQVPFFILRSLYRCLFGVVDISDEHIKSMAGPFKWKNRPISDKDKKLPPIKITLPHEEIYHLLHLCHHINVPADKLDCELPMIHELKHAWSVWSLPCATQMREAGVKIKRKKPPCHLTNVTFQSGTLEIPYFRIGDVMPIILMNLVALEQCESLKLPQVIGPYNMFMDAVVNTREDVMILERRGIIENLLSGEEAVAIFFNQTGQGVEIRKNHYLARMFMEVNEYCWSRKHRYRAKLTRDYFSNPWSVLSVFAAIFLLLLTCTQTFYAVFSYHHAP